jgi:hypothetical protein
MITEPTQLVLDPASDDWNFTHETLLGFRGGSMMVDCKIIETSGNMSKIRFFDELDSMAEQWVETDRLTPLD